MLDRIKKLPIRLQFIYVVIIIIIIICIFIIFTYANMSNIIIKKNSEYINANINQTEQTISQYYSAISRIMLYIGYNSTIQDFLNEEDESKRYELSKKVDSILINVNSLSEGINNNIMIEGVNGNRFGYLDKVRSDRLNEVIKDKNRPYCIGVYVDKLQNTSNNSLLFGYSVYDLNQTHKKIGEVYVVVSYEGISSNIKLINESKSTGYYLLDRKSQVIVGVDSTKNINYKSEINKYTNYKQGYYKEKINGISIDINVVNIDQINGKLICFVDNHSLLMELSNTRIYAMILLLLILAAITAISLFAINNIIHPIEKLSKFISSINSGDIKTMKYQIHINAYIEINELVSKFNNLMGEIGNLTNNLVESNTRLYKAELIKKKTELLLLRNQINPHFLYNTLELIRSVSNVKGVYDVRDIAVALAQLLRYSIKGLETVRVVEEIEIVKYYIHIQKIRFKNRITDKYILSDRILDSLIIKMIIQPLVENAIYHGIEPKIGEGVIIIEGKIIDNNVLEISVCDNGVGVDEHTLKSIQCGLDDDGENDEAIMGDSFGIGLFNVHNRIRLTFGRRYGISIHSEKGIGTEISLRIPLRMDVNV